MWHGLDHQRDRQANIAFEKFLSLIGDVQIDRITSETAEKLRAKLKDMPNLYGRTIYAGLSAEQALVKAKRLRRDIAADGEQVMMSGKKVPPEQAKRWAEAVTLKTINRDLTFFTTWGKWMLKIPVRKRQLHLSTPNKDKPLSRKSPIAYMARGGQAAVAQTLRCHDLLDLQAVAGGAVLAHSARPLPSLRNFAKSDTISLVSASGSVALSEMRPEQCRAARGLLDWTRDQLSTSCGVTKRTILRFESGEHEIRPATLAAIRAALEAAGVEFTSGGQPGVRLRKLNP